MKCKLVILTFTFICAMSFSQQVIPMSTNEGLFPDDVDFLSNPHDTMLNIIDNYGAGTYFDYPQQLDKIKSLLVDDSLSIADSELTKLTKVKKIILDAGGIYEYNYFKCAFTFNGKGLYYRKLAGSQRQSGYVYRKDDSHLLFIGGSTVNDDPLTTYDVDNSVVGLLYKKSSADYVMLCHENNHHYILLFSK